MYMYIALFFLGNVTSLLSLYLLVHTVLITHSMRHRARVETQCFFYVYIYTDADWLHSGSGTRNSFFTWRSLRADCFSRHRLYTLHAMPHTQRANLARTGWLDACIFSLSLSPTQSPSTPTRSLTHYLSVCLFLGVSLSFFHSHRLSLPSSGRRRTRTALPGHAFTRPLTKENPSTPTNRTTFQRWWGWRESTTTDVEATSLSLFRS